MKMIAFSTSSSVHFQAMEGKYAVQGIPAKGQYLTCLRTCSQVMTGSYNNYFHVYERNTKNETILQADKSAFKAKRLGSAKSKLGSRTLAGKSNKDLNLDTVDYNKKILHASWHPFENSIAVAATNNLFIFT